MPQHGKLSGALMKRSSFQDKKHKVLTSDADSVSFDAPTWLAKDTLWFVSSREANGRPHETLLRRPEQPKHVPALNLANGVDPYCARHAPCPPRCPLRLTGAEAPYAWRTDSTATCLFQGSANPARGSAYLRYGKVLKM